MKHNSDFKFDLDIGVEAEGEFGAIINNKKVEVKYDRKAHQTGNVYIEYMYKGSPSGISHTQSDVYCYKIKDTFILMSTADIKEKMRKWKHVCQTNDWRPEDTWKVKGGDSNKSIGMLIPIVDFITL